MCSHVGRCSLSQRLNECRPNVSRLRFGLRAALLAKKWSPARSLEHSRSPPLTVPLPGECQWEVRLAGAQGAVISWGADAHLGS